MLSTPFYNSTRVPRNTRPYSLPGTAIAYK